MKRTDSKKNKLTKFMEMQLEPFLLYDLKERSVYSKQVHLKLLLSASLVNGFATGVSNALGDSPTGETLLSYIKEQKEEMLKKAFDSLINENVSRLRRRRRFRLPLPVAVDLHDVMYYGDHDFTPMIIGTKHTDGSNYAFEYLTASVLVDGARLIVAVHSLKSRKDIPSCTAQIIRKLREQLKVRIRYLIFDGGFFSIAILRLLELSKLRYIVRMAQTNKTKGMRLWHGRRFTYTTSGHHRKKSEQISFEVAVVYDKTKGYKYLFATNLPSYYKPETILKLFKTRWGIETSYRVSNQFLIKTTSRNYIVRLFYYLFACLVYNAWVMYNSKASSKGEISSIAVIELKIILLIGLVSTGFYSSEEKRT
jgi:hypothetical protein